MKIDKNHLIQTYSAMASDELIELSRSNELTSDASAVLNEVLEDRRIDNRHGATESCEISGAAEKVVPEGRKPLLAKAWFNLVYAWSAIAVYAILMMWEWNSQVVRDSVHFVGAVSTLAFFVFMSLAARNLSADLFLWVTAINSISVGVFVLVPAVFVSEPLYVAKDFMPAGWILTTVMVHYGYMQLKSKFRNSDMSALSGRSAEQAGMVQGVGVEAAPQIARVQDDIHETKESRVTFAGTDDSDEVLWERALMEFEGDSRKAGLWAKSFSEAGGDEHRAKARYLEERVRQLTSVAQTHLGKR